MLNLKTRFGKQFHIQFRRRSAAWELLGTHFLTVYDSRHRHRHRCPLKNKFRLVKVCCGHWAQAAGSVGLKARRTLSSEHTSGMPRPTGLTLSPRNAAMWA